MIRKFVQKNGTTFTNSPRREAWYPRVQPLTASRLSEYLATPTTRHANPGIWGWRRIASYPRWMEG